MYEREMSRVRATERERRKFLLRPRAEAMKGADRASKVNLYAALAVLARLGRLQTICSDRYRSV